MLQENGDNRENRLANLLLKVGLLFCAVTLVAIILLSLTLGLQPCGWLDKTILKHSGCLGELEQAFSIRDVVFMPNGDVLVTASFHGQINVWRVVDKISILTLDENDDLPAKVAVSPDGEVLAASSGYQVKLWWVNDGTLMQVIGRYRDIATDVTFSPNGSLLAVAVRDYQQNRPNKPLHMVQLWQLMEDSPIHVLQGPMSHVQSVAFSPDGTILASASGDTVWLWRVNDGTLLRTLKGHTNVVESIVFSPDGRVLASGSWDKAIRLWQVSDGTCLRVLEAILFK